MDGTLQLSGVIFLCEGVAISRLEDAADKIVADPGFADLLHRAGKDRLHDTARRLAAG